MAHLRHSPIEVPPPPGRKLFKCCQSVVGFQTYNRIMCITPLWVESLQLKLKSRPPPHKSSLYTSLNKNRPEHMLTCKIVCSSASLVTVNSTVLDPVSLRSGFKDFFFCEFFKCIDILCSLTTVAYYAKSSFCCEIPSMINSYKSRINPFFLTKCLDDA